MRRILLLLVLLAAAGCTRTPLAAGGGDTVLRHGTSFGMCLGYCVTELAVTDNELVLTRTSREPAANPTRVERLPLRPAERDALLGLVDPGRFDGLQEVYGCPDCADGGAEYVELVRDGRTRRVTFEYGSNVPGIERLIARLRDLRARFPER